MIVGFVLAIIGVIGMVNEVNASNAASEKQVTQAARSQGLTITGASPDGATVIGDKCTLTADFVDHKLVLTGSDPAIVLTPDYVALVCQGVSR